MFGKMNDFVKPRPRKRRPVISQELYLAELKAIIAKDYFPDKGQLDALNDLLEAEKTRNFDRIETARRKYLEVVDCPSKQPKTSADMTSKARQEGDSTEVALRVGEYLRRHTSEDNEAFRLIQVDARQKHKDKYWWAYALRPQDKNAEGEKLEGEAGRQLNFNRYEPFNGSMYPLAGQRLKSVTYEADLIGGEKEVRRSNTRLDHEFMLKQEGESFESPVAQQYSVTLL
jgi:hypothetical protein